VLKHNIALRKGTTAKGKLLAKGKVVGKGGVSKITLKVAKGKYRFVCTVLGHEAGGMWGILTVK
jgi:azurin